MHPARSSSFLTWAPQDCYLPGCKLRPGHAILQKSLAKAATALYGAASVTDKAGWSGPAAEAFRDLIRRSRVLDEPLGTGPMRGDAERLSRNRVITADEGSPAENGGWILWFPPDALAALVKSLDNYKAARLPWDEIYQAVQRTVPRMRGAWYPGTRDWDHRDVAKRISIPAVAAASEATGIPMGDLDEAALDVTANVDTALCRAMRAKCLADACRVFREAAARDADTEALFLRTGFVPPKNVAVPEDPGWYGDVAAAVLETGWRGHGAYAVRGERSTDGPRTTAFRAAAFETSRAEIKKYFASDEAAELFTASPGAYRNCPAPDRQANG